MGTLALTLELAIQKSIFESRKFGHETLHYKLIFTGITFSPMFFLSEINFSFLVPRKQKSGGAGYRSLCLTHAKRALYHLSYTPTTCSIVLLTASDKKARAKPTL